MCNLVVKGDVGIEIEGVKTISLHYWRCSRRVYCLRGAIISTIEVNTMQTCVDGRQEECIISGMKIEISLLINYIDNEWDRFLGEWI